VFNNLNELLLRYFDLIPLHENINITRQSAKLEFGELVNSIHLTAGCGEHLINSWDMSELWAIREHWQEMAHEELKGLLEELVEFLSFNKDNTCPTPA
jgi:hypothetical protein